MMRKSLISVLLIATTLEVCSQSIVRQVIGSAGGTLQNSAGTVSYTMGEPLVEILNSPGSQAGQGFHQGSDLLVSALGHQTAPFVQVYPNPARNDLHVRFDGDVAEWVLFTMGGSIVGQGQLTTGDKQIDIRQLAASTYLLSITQGMRNTAFRIVKE
jgi:hypothetical protein